MKIAERLTVTATVPLGVVLGAQRPTFDAVSIKVTASGDPGQNMKTLPGRLVAQNMTLQSLIWQAYEVRPGQVDTNGAPGWVGSDHVDIEATFTPSAAHMRCRSCSRTLLADRFKLVVRHETRKERAYSLVFAQPNRSLDPTLRQARNPQCVSPGRGGRDGANAPAGCGDVQFGPGHLVGTSIRWMQLVNALSGLPAAGGPVVNGAGDQAGLYDFELRWTPTTRGGALDRGENGRADAPGSIFTAVREQLDLKLDPTDGPPLPMIVVTDARRPEPN
jgi:uncharacterized protein (TIGR03435 family)